MTDLTKDSPATKECPFCSEVIHINAKKCKHCGEILDPVLRKQNEGSQPPPQVINVATSVSQSTKVSDRRRGFPHLIHFIMTVLTGGFWLIIWILHYIFRGPQYR